MQQKTWISVIGHVMHMHTYIRIQVREFSSSEDEAENTDDEESGDESESEMFSSLTQNVLTSMSLTPCKLRKCVCIYTF